MAKSTKDLLFERMRVIGGMRTPMDEYLLLENPNAAKKFLDQNNLSIDTEKGKDIFDKITNITRGDGYTLLLTKFLVIDKLSLEDIQKIHTFLKNNKEILKSLPREASTYDSYRNLRNDIDKVEDNKIIKKLYNELTAILKKEYDNGSTQIKLQFNELARKYNNIEQVHKKMITKKISSFYQLDEFNSFVNNIINNIASGDDIKSVYDKIVATDGAKIAYIKDNILIANIRKFEASQKLGCTTSWCITRNMRWYNSYKKGNKYYFFIWDFSYSSDQNEYLIGTAFNANSPSSSDTFVKENIRTNLIGTLEDKELDVSILQDYVSKHKEEAKMEMEKKMGDGNTFLSLILKAKNNDQDAINLLAEQIANELEASLDDVEVTSETIKFSDPSILFEFIDLDTEAYDYIESHIHSYYGSDGEFYSLDDDAKNQEISYLLTDEMVEILKKIARHVGVHKSFPDDKWAGGTMNLSEFLKKIGKYDDYIEEFQQEYDRAYERAKENTASNIINSLIFDDEGTIELDKIIEKASENNENYITFKEFTDSLPVDDIHYDALLESYNYVDYDELYTQMTSFLENLEFDLENDDSQYHKNIESYKTLENVLNKLGFEFNSNQSDGIAQLETEDRIIKILEMDEDMVVIDIYYKPDFYYNNKLEKPKDRHGKVKPENLVNYVKQLQIPLQEKIKEASKNKLMERMRKIGGMK